MKSLYNKTYLTRDTLIVNRLFYYIKNYLYEHEEKDHLNMDFVETIISFFNTFLILIYFKKEESVLFINLNNLSIKNKKKKATNEQPSIEQVVKQLSILQYQYNAGDNSCIEQIHSMLKTLITSYNKEKLNNDLLQFNQNIIKQLDTNSIIEKYQKYNITSK